MSSKKSIFIISILIPILIAILFSVKIDGYDLTFLPAIYASINAFTAALLIVSLILIKNNYKVLHEKVMMLALFCSLIFLILYIAYHATSSETSFGGEGAIAIFYYVILISHIVLSMLVVPLVLFSVHYAKNANFVAHKKIVKWSYPLWLYVAISGVIVYLLISPYYA